MKFNPWNRFKAKIAMFHFFMHLVASLHIAHHLYRGFYLRLSHQCWQKTSLFISYGLMLNLMMQGKCCNFSWGLWSKLVPQGLRWDFLSVCLISCVCGGSFNAIKVYSKQYSVHSKCFFYPQICGQVYCIHLVWKNLPVQEIWVRYTRCFFWYFLHTSYVRMLNGFVYSCDWMMIFPALLLYYRRCSYSCLVPSLPRMKTAGRCNPSWRLLNWLMLMLKCQDAALVS